MKMDPIHYLAASICLAVAILLEGTLASARESPPEPEHEFTFVVLGDSQFHHPNEFNRIIDEVVHLYPAFVIQVGDMIKGYVEDLEEFRSEWDRFKAQIAPLADIPFFPVPGNHDLIDASRKPGGEAIYREVWGDTYYSFNYRNAHFVVLNTDDQEDNEIRGPQLAWLKQDLKESKEQKHIFVFCHRPTYELEGEDELHSLFVESGVDAVIYGHRHHYNYRERDGIPYVMTVSAAKMGPPFPLGAGSFHHMLLVTVRDKAFRIAVLKAGSVLPPDIVAPEDNEGLWSLQRRFFSEKKVAFSSLPRNGNTYEVTMLVNNPSTQNLSVYFEWYLPNERWAVDPQKGRKIELAAGAKDQPVTFDLVRRFPHPPEDYPSCIARALYLTSDGDVVQTEYTFEIVADVASEGD